MPSRPGRQAAVLAVAAAFLALLAGEAAVAALGLDWRLLRPLLYYQADHLPVHRLSDDVERHYELAPGTSAAPGKPKRVTVNALGFRGPERAAVKPAGVFRIICLGGSNVYGTDVEDNETFPARLEAELNRSGRRRFEVWNGGVSAYTAAQDAAAARAALARYAPDLLIFRSSNQGRRAFLAGAPFERYFRADPSLWSENLPWPERPSPLHEALMRRWRLYRAAVLAVNLAAASRAPRAPGPGTQLPRQNARNVEAFAAVVRDSPVPVVLLGMGLHPRVAAAKPRARVLDLLDRLPPRAGPEYRRIHPTAPVYAWYARELAAFLRKERLVP